MKNNMKYFISGIILTVLIYGIFVSTRTNEIPEKQAPTTMKTTSVQQNSQGTVKNNRTDKLARPSQVPNIAESKQGNESKSLVDDNTTPSDSDDNTYDKQVVVDPYILHREFPDNLALPSLNEDDAKKKRDDRRKRDLEFGQIQANRATEEEINAFYAHQTQLAKDGLQIVEFVLKKYRTDFNEKNLKKHEFLVKAFKDRLEKIPTKQEEALERRRNKKLKTKDE